MLHLCISEGKRRDTAKDNHVYNLKLEPNILLITRIFLKRPGKYYRIILLGSNSDFSMLSLTCSKEKKTNHQYHHIQNSSSGELPREEKLFC